MNIINSISKPTKNWIFPEYFSSNNISNRLDLLISVIAIGIFAYLGAKTLGFYKAIPKTPMLSASESLKAQKRRVFEKTQANPPPGTFKEYYRSDCIELSIEPPKHNGKCIPIYSEAVNRAIADSEHPKHREICYAVSELQKGNRLPAGSPLYLENLDYWIGSDYATSALIERATSID